MVHILKLYMTNTYLNLQKTCQPIFEKPNEDKLTKLFTSHEVTRQTFYKPYPDFYTTAINPYVQSKKISTTNKYLGKHLSLTD